MEGYTLQNSTILQNIVKDETTVTIVVNDNGALNTLSPCRILAQDGVFIEFQYIKTGNDMIYVYQLSDVKQIRYEIAV